MRKKAGRINEEESRVGGAQVYCLAKVGAKEQENIEEKRQKVTD